MAALHSLNAVVTQIVFYSEESGYTVAEMQGEQSFTAVGAMPKLVIGDQVQLEGEFVEHALYGEQLQVKTISIVTPETAEAIELFLRSGAVKGIGPSLAKRIVKRFGETSLNVIRDSPTKLATISGISLNMATSFQTQLQNRRAEQELALILLPAGISFNRVRRILHTLGMGAVELVRQDPWIIMRLVNGVGFETANKVAAALGFAHDHPMRIRSAFWQLLYLRLGAGHTFARREVLSQELSSRLSLDAQTVNRVLADGVEGIDFYEKEGVAFCAFTNVFNMELDVARRVQQLSKGHSHRQIEASVVRDFAAHSGLAISAEQTAAVRMALTAPFSIITGGPGTGKTTIVRTLVNLARNQGLKVLLAAPTGRAARRLQEAAGKHAMTLHRLLNISIDDSLLSQESDPETITGDLLIIDECSMVDLHLFWRVLKALPPNMCLVLVGDVDQLPSVGAGQILRDLLSIDGIARTVLTRIYRQSEDNLIVLNAHHLKNGEPLHFVQQPDSPFLATYLSSDEEMVTTLTRFLAGPAKTHYDIDDLRDVQVLAPVHRGAAGVRQLNARLQAEFHAEQIDGLATQDVTFCLGDKVIQTRNNYELAWQQITGSRTGLGVMNGEMGIVTHVDREEKTLEVVFENERRAQIAEDDLLDLDLAYAITIHKSQGSEYPIVCLVIGHVPPDFLTINLIYTAITRAKARLILFTKRRTLERLLRERRISTRETNLARMLQSM